MRKKFVQTLAARQLEFGGQLAADEMELEKQSNQQEQQQQQQQQQDGSGEEIIEILDDDQEVELMMERHRKYHPRKYVNLQHPTSKIYYDKIDKIVPAAGDREDQEVEDEDERNQQLVIEECPKELNNNHEHHHSHNSSNSSNTTSASIGNGSIGREDHHNSGLPAASYYRRTEEDTAILLQEYHYRRLYGYSSSGHTPPQNVAPVVPPVREQQHQQHLQQQGLLNRVGQTFPDILPPPPPHQPSSHPASYERSHPYERYAVPYDRSVTTTNPSPYYRRKAERRMSVHSNHRAAAAAAAAKENGSFLAPGPRKEGSRGEKRKSAFSPPNEKMHSTRHDGPKISAPALPPPPLPNMSVTETTNAVVTPHTPPYYQHQHPVVPHAYHRPVAGSSPSSGSSNSNNSYLALEDWYRTGVPPPHMLTTADLQSMYYYHYYLNKMAAAASSAYHHPYRDNTAPVGTASRLGGATIVPAPATAYHPPPQYGFAKGGDLPPALYGAAQQQPFDYTVYHSLLARTSYASTSSAYQTQTAISLASSTVPSPSAPSSPSSSEGLRPTVINRAPNNTTTTTMQPPGVVPRTVPVNLVRPRGHYTVVAEQHMSPTLLSGAAAASAFRGEQDSSTRPNLPTIPPTTIPNNAYNERRHYESGTVPVAADASSSDSCSPLYNVALAVVPSAHAENKKPSETVTSSERTASKSSVSKDTPKGGGHSAVKSTTTTTSASSTSTSFSLSTTGRSEATPTVSRPRGRPPGAKNKEPSGAAAKASATAGRGITTTTATAPATVTSSTTTSTILAPTTTPTVTTATPTAGGTPNPPSQGFNPSSSTSARVQVMRKEINQFLERRRAEIISTMRLYSVGRIDFGGLLQEMQRHSVIYRDFLQVAFTVMHRSGLKGFTQEPPAELNYRWKSPPQEFADYFAQNEQCTKAFVAENFDFLVLIVDNLLQQYIEPLEYFLLSYVLGLRVK